MSNVTGRIIIGPTLRNRYKIPYMDNITVRVGCRLIQTKMVVLTNGKNGFMLSPELAQALYIKKGHKLRFRYDSEEGMIHLGPTVGILVNRISNQANPDPKSVQAELMYLLQLSKNLPGQFYVFTPKNINWERKTVQGYNYRHGSSEKGHWVASTYPLPDVVYDRIPTRRMESLRETREARTKLFALPYLKYFNPAFLNKWEVHQALSANPDLLPYMPETRVLDLAELEAMLEKYRVLFLKPCNGSLGRGIIYVRKKPNGQLYYISYPSGRERGPFQSARAILERTAAVRRGRAYLVQEGLDLAKYRGSAFDIRIIYQKNGLGQWQIGKKFARLAAGGSNITNLSSGGVFLTYSRLMRYLYRGETRKKKTHAIKELCKTVALTLERECEGVYGELGLDIGLGRNGIPYLIEVNSKPRKTTRGGKMGAVAGSFRRPLEFACYLAGFPKNKN